MAMINPVNPTHRFISQRTKFTIAFTLLAMVAIGSALFSYYGNVRLQLRQDARERLNDAVAIAALQIDGDQHALLTDPSQEGNDVYLQFKSLLQSIRDAGTNIGNVYTLRQDALGNIIFIVSAEDNEEDISHLGTIYEDAGPLLVENFTSMDHSMVEEGFHTDKWGTWLTGYAPFYNEPGQREGILGMVISASNVVAGETQALWNALAIFVITIPLVSLFGWYLGSRLTRPLADLSTGVRRFVDGDLTQRINIQTHDEVESTAESINALADRLNESAVNLEQQIADRTTRLTRRTNQLRSAARVARDAAEFQQVDILLNNTCSLISDNLGFYHVGIFILDQHHQYAILQATSSEAGKHMLERGHRLEVGRQGLVGAAAFYKLPQTFRDISQDPSYQDNPDLPETRSEVALPLLVRGKVIGVLDLQSREVQEYEQEDIDLLQILADQIALTIENTRLISESQAIIEQFSALASDEARQAWDRLIQISRRAFHYTPTGVTRSTKSKTQEGETRTEESPNAISVPLPLRGEKIGTISLQRKGSSKWAQTEIAMIQDIARQIGLAIENARLVEDSQRLALRERQINLIASQAQRSTDLETILQNTLRELGKVLNAPRTFIQIGLSETGQKEKES